jgi:hypothetical protein
MGSARRPAENGATEAELDAIFGWTDRRMASHSTRKANRKKLAYGGVAKLERTTGSMDHRATVYFPHRQARCGKSSKKLNQIRRRSEEWWARQGSNL